MLKNLLKKSVFTAVTATLLSAATATAQTTPTIYWGSGHTNTLLDSMGKFTADANGSIAHLGWTLNDNATDPAATWSYTTTGASIGAISATWIANGGGSTMTSPSISTGAVIFDSENICNILNDDDTHQGAHLVSPSFHLVNAAGKFVTIKLYTNFLNFQTDTFSVELSTDGGTTYEGGDILVETGQTAVRGNYNGWVYIPIPTQLSSNPAQLNNCRIRIIYHGNYYYFSVDDISIIESAAKDLAISTPFDDGTLGGAFSTFRVSNNYSMPLSQVSELDSTQFLFGAKLSSKGSSNIEAADGATLNVTIEHNDNGTWSTVHQDAIVIDSLISGADSIFISDFVGNWRPTAIGEYKVTYSAELANTTDENLSNNTSSHTFFITEDYYSKVPTSATTGFPSITRGIFPAAGATGNKVTEFEYGSMFFFPGTSTDPQYKLDSISYTTLLSTATSPTFNNTVNIAISKFTDLDANGTISDSPTSGELSIVGLGTHTMTATVGTSNLSVGGHMTDILDVNTMGEVIFEHNELYLVSFKCENPTGLYTNNLYNTYLPGAYSINYGLNAAYSDAVPSPARTKIVTSTGADASHTWNWIGFGADIASTIGLNISERIVSVENTQNEATNFSIFPNPTSDVINVNLAFDAATTAQIIMTDVTGRVVRLHTQKDAIAENVSFNVNDLSAGVYYISVKTEAGVSTQKFVKK